MLCDQDDPDTASWFVYMGLGVVYDSRPFMTDGVGWPLYLGDDGSLQNNRCVRVLTLRPCDDTVYVCVQRG
jgi:hypothetical protein